MMCNVMVLKTGKRQFFLNTEARSATRIHGLY